MHKYDAGTEEIAQLCFDYSIARLRLDPVPLDGPLTLPELETLAGRDDHPEGPASRGGHGALRAKCSRRRASRTTARSSSRSSPGAPTKASQLFDVVVSASAIYGGSWLEGSGAVFAENQALRWVADLAGLPDGARGLLRLRRLGCQPLRARRRAREAAARRGGDRPARWRVALGDQAHSSLESTIRIMDAVPLVVPTGDDDRLDGADVRAALDADPDPDSVFAVVGTGGTTNTGQIDDLDGIATVAHERDLWFHVDGAYGLAALAAPSVRDRFRGIEHADSLVVDPHKWLFAPFDCAALVYRDPELARLAHTQHAAYLDAIESRDEWNPSDYAYHLTRRARGLPFWFSLAVHGTDAYSHAIERTLAIARDAAQRIDAAPHVELVRRPELGVVLWRRHGWTAADYTTWSRRLLTEQRAFVVPTTWRDETVARAVFLNPECPPEIIEDILESMR